MTESTYIKTAFLKIVTLKQYSLGVPCRCPHVDTRSVYYTLRQYLPEALPRHLVNVLKYSIRKNEEWEF